MRFIVTLGALAMATQVAFAQKAPDPTKPIKAAQKAADAANARTRAASGEAATTPASADTTRSAKGKAVVTDSAAGSTNAPLIERSGEPFERETFAYESGGRRDPFVSLMSVDELRPFITDLKIVAIVYDRTGRNSVAILHDVSTSAKEQYRVRVGQSLGRMRVSSIAEKHVMFTIEEFGFSRQEKLELIAPNQERKQ